MVCGLCTQFLIAQYRDYADMKKGGQALTQQPRRKTWIIPRRIVPDAQGHHFSSRSTDPMYIQPHPSSPGSPTSEGNNEDDISTPCLFPPLPHRLSTLHATCSHFHAVSLLFSLFLLIVSPRFDTDQRPPIYKPLFHFYGYFYDVVGNSGYVTSNCKIIYH